MAEVVIREDADGGSMAFCPSQEEKQ